MQSEYGPLTETQNEEFHKMAKLVESHDKEGQFNSFIDKLCDGPLDRIKKELIKNQRENAMEADASSILIKLEDKKTLKIPLDADDKKTLKDNLFLALF